MLTTGMAVLRSMLESDTPRNIRTWNSALALCSDCGAALRAVSLLDMLVQDGFRPDLVSYNTAISACARTGEVSLALELLQQVATATFAHSTAADSTNCAAVTAQHSLKW
jgi:pentatricopeptide repeat domain-containing protein 1